MSNELIVSGTQTGLRIAILENRRLVELHFEQRNNPFAVGDIYLGSVKRLNSSMNAAFVDIGHERDAFLHYTDLGPQIRSQLKFFNQVMNDSGRPMAKQLEHFKPLPDIEKTGKITEVLKPGMTIPVLIMKEAISTKGVRLASELSFAGEYLILLPFGQDISVSRRFKSGSAKGKVKKMLAGVKPNNFGVIVRTAAEGVEFEKLKDDLDRLTDRWSRLVDEVSVARPPKKVLSEMDRTSTILRDMLSIGFDNIVTDDKTIYDDLKDYLGKHQPEVEKNLHYRQSRVGVFETLGIERQIKSSFGRNVNLSNGSYLVIEHTEALHVVDVNSGSQRFQDKNPEDNALHTNLEAAAEIARQLRLRDMGGIIVVDFIDMRSNENKKEVYQHFKKEMQKDRARHTVLPISRFGLLQVTRQRVRPEVTINTDESCPCCNGTGKIQPAILLADEVERTLDYLIQQTRLKSVRVQCNPFLAAFFRVGFPNRQLRWWWKYKTWVRLQADSSLPFTEVRYLNKQGEKIRLD